MLSQWFRTRSSSSLVLWTNSLEFLDLYLFIHFGWLIDKLFFQGWAPSTITIFTFCNIYLIAPLACIFFGTVGDLRGRKIVIISTSLMMGIISLTIIALPVELFPYFSACALILMRVFQGIALGGEPMAAYLYMMEEHKDVRQATFYNCVVATTEGVGGVLALSIGFLVLYFLGEQHWRIIFLSVSVFVWFVYLIRRHLKETSDYMDFLSDQKIRLHEKEKIREIYQFGDPSVLWPNKIAGFLIWLSYPSLFFICYLHLTPFVCQKMGWTEQNMLLYNLLVTLGEHGLRFLLFSVVIYKTNFDLKRTGIFCNLVGLILISSCLLFLDEWPVVTIFMAQIGMMSLINYGWITPDIFKTFSVIGRFSLMSRTWALARFANFFICIFILNALIESWGLGKGSLILIVCVNVISFAAFFLMKPYSSFEYRRM
jgi:MFS family permease